jgi:hypothetical protein
VRGGDWRYRAEQAEGSFEGQHPSLVPCKTDGSVIDHHTFLADDEEDGYYGGGAALLCWRRGAPCERLAWCSAL